MSKHTPGPWTMQRWSFDDDCIVASVVAEDYGVGIAYGYPRGRHDGHKVASRIEGMANARLMAAAPDLLEALKAVLADRAYQKLSGGQHFTSAQTEHEWKRESAMKAWALVKLAIAKAEGGQ